jgi:heat shock protein HslJ
MRLATLLVTATLELAGIPPLAAQTAPGARWIAFEAGGLALTEGDEVTLDFDDGRISGRSGCNRFTGAAALTAGTPASGALTLGPLAGTRMACIGRADGVEAAVLAALAAVDGWRIEPDGTLALTGAGTALLRARPR